MGNYLLSLRVPPSATADQDERNHPNYYDWSLPKEHLFRQSPQTPTVATEAKQAAAAVVVVASGGGGKSVAGKKSADAVASQDVDSKQSSGQMASGFKKTKAHSNTDSTSYKTTKPTANSLKESQTGANSKLSTKETKTAVATVSRTSAVESLQSKSTAGKSPKSSASRLTNQTLSKDSPIGRRGSKGAGNESAASGKVLVNETAVKRPASESIDGQSDKSRPIR